MIDQAAREKLRQIVVNTQVQQGFSEIVQAIKNNGQDNELNDELIQNLLSRLIILNNTFESQMIGELKGLQEAFIKVVLTADELQKLKLLSSSVNEKITGFEILKEKIQEKQIINFPKETKVSGKVDVGTIQKLPDLKISNFPEIPQLPEKYPIEGDVGITNMPPVIVGNLPAVIQSVKDLELSFLKAIKSLQTKFPDSFKISQGKVSVEAFDELLDGIEELKKGFNLLINKEAATVGFPDKTIPVEIQNWMIPQPVTNVSINPNRGTVLATAVTVTSSLTPLPGTALADRRSMTIYNNSGSTIFVGGANVTAASGIPVPVGTYGPSLDAGPLNIVYAVTSSGSADVRILEMNDLNVGGDN